MVLEKMAVLRSATVWQSRGGGSLFLKSALHEGDVIVQQLPDLGCKYRTGRQYLHNILPVQTQKLLWYVEVHAH